MDDELEPDDLEQGGELLPDREVMSTLNPFADSIVDLGLDTGEQPALPGGAELPAELDEVGL